MATKWPFLRTNFQFFLFQDSDHNGSKRALGSKTRLLKSTCFDEKNKWYTFKWWRFFFPFYVWSVKGESGITFPKVFILIFKISLKHKKHQDIQSRIFLLVAPWPSVACPEAEIDLWPLKCCLSLIWWNSRIVDLSGESLKILFQIYNPTAMWSIKWSELNLNPSFKSI